MSHSSYVSLMSIWFFTFLALVATTMCEECDNTLVQTKTSLMRAPKVAVYVQIGTQDSKIWEDLYMCISNVAKSQPRQVDVFVSSVVGHEESVSYSQNLSHVDGISKVVVQELENRGADVGQFLHQISATDIQGYRAVLKIHTKTRRFWRQYMIQNLCGSPDAARAAVEFFQTNPDVGIIGPHTLTQFGRYVTYAPGSLFCQLLECESGEPPTRPIFDMINDFQAMTWVWKVMNGNDLPRDDLWTIIAGDMFWIRGACLNNGQILRAIPILLNNMTEGYVEGSFGKPEHALERWIPTFLRVNGWMVAEMSLGAGQTNVQLREY
eukprot:s2336_g4.t1